MTAQPVIDTRRTAARGVVPRLLSLHRWLGLLACLAVLMFASSGLLHPVMSRLQPQPVQRQAPAPQFGTHRIALGAVLRAHGIDAVAAATVVQLDDGAAYRVQVDERSARYFSTSDGREIADGERIHAELLARHFSGEQAARLLVLGEVHEFDDDYLPVNRLLPVWRVRFDRADGLTAYVDTRGNRLATQVDDRKRVLQTTFRTLHDFAFLDALPALRVSLMLVLLVAAFATAVFGIAIFFTLKASKARLQRSAARRWHRRLALPIAVTTLTFSASGTWHLLQGESAAAQKTYAAAPQSFATAELQSDSPQRAFSLLRVAGKACYRLAAAPVKPMGDEHAHHHGMAMPHDDAPAASCIDAADGAALDDAERSKAIELARYFSGSAAQVASAEQVTAFSGEYGFINKRLPVWRIVFDDSSTRWYVETASGALALRADDAAALEGFVFAYVHKWIFFGEHKDIRDALMMAFALGNVVVGLLGLWVFFKRPLRAM